MRYYRVTFFDSEMNPLGYVDIYPKIVGIPPFIPVPTRTVHIEEVSY